MAARPEPGLRAILLRWLLGPLLVLLAIDTGVSYWTSQRAADLALLDGAVHGGNPKNARFP